MNETTKETVERWDIFEAAFKGPETDNPFVDVTLTARFRHKNRLVEIDGFYDGDGVYRVRFMPDTVGEWSYELESNRPELDAKSGTFTCVEPSADNHGPVRVRDTFHFAYADGTPYAPIGTTCYAWIHQGDELEEQTLKTLAQSPFNKLRMCVFPKYYPYNRNEPVHYPFERDENGEWDFTRFNPTFFHHLEGRIAQLRDLGIEADVILFHPYDRWGFAEMGPEADDRYLRYTAARLSAYRNIWWSMANEYDLMESKSMADWDRFFKIVQESDPAQHLRSVHNCHQFYDHGKPWVTHCSVQRHDLNRVKEWRDTYGKPVVVDECGYEGDVEHNWGNLPARELVHRFWVGTVCGGYVGHGETYLHPDDVLWWSKGGVLHGESAERIAFLREIVERDLGGTPEPVVHSWRKKAVGDEDGTMLYYLDVNQPAKFPLELPDEAEYQVDVIDPWKMTVEPLEGTVSGGATVELPGRPYLALRVRKVN